MMRVDVTAELDLPQIASLHARCFSDAWSAREFQNLLATGNVFCLVVGQDEPQGFVLIRTAADEAEILSIAVAPQARRQGIARALVRAGGGGAFARGARR